MIVFLIATFLSFSISLYLAELPYSQYKYNCSTLFALPVQQYAIIALILLLVCTLSYINSIRCSWRYGAACGLLLGGGLYHTYARLSDGCVLDYFKLSKVYFNISDVFIVTAITFLIIFSFIFSEP